MKFSLAKGLTAIIDKEDYELVSPYRWNFNNGAVTTNIVSGNGKRTTLKMHRLILGLPPNRPIVDHINGNQLDNRKSNLRVCDHSSNLMNRGKNRNNKSGYKGVFWSKAAKKWAAQVSVKGKKYHLGLYDSPTEAHKAYIEKSKEVHKEFSHV